MTSPLVSVVIPARNAAVTVAEQLLALQAQDFSGPWEVVLVDNGSTDQTAEIAQQTFAHPASSLRVIVENRPGLNYARNAGIANSRAPLVALCDADDVVDSGWLSAMVEGLRHADIVAGRLETSRLNSTKARELRGWPGGGALLPSINTDLEFLDQVMFGNAALKRSTWATIGGFDTSFTGGGDDIEFGWRAQLAGYTINSCDKAVLSYRARDDRRSLWRQYDRDGQGAAHLYAVFSKRGMPRRQPAAAARTWLWVLRRLPLIWRQPVVEQGHVLRVAAKLVGRLRGSIRHRVLFL